MLILKNLLFLLVVPGTVAVYVPLLLARGRSAAGGPRLLPALILLASGGVVCAWCVWNFAVFGGGTPAPIDAPKKLVVRGLYRYTRNPMYVGVLTVLLGWAVMFGSTGLLFYTVCIGACFHLFVVLYEEPHLRKKFGTAYQGYCTEVGRWLPHFRRQ